MESFLSFFCIFVLCMFVYGYIMMKNKHKNHSNYCNVLYVPRIEKEIENEMDQSDIISSQNTFTNPMNRPPRGISDIEYLLPTLNQRYDTIELREMGE